MRGHADFLFPLLGFWGSNMVMNSEHSWVKQQWGGTTESRLQEIMDRVWLWGRRGREGGRGMGRRGIEEGEKRKTGKEERKGVEGRLGGERRERAERRGKRRRRRGGISASKCSLSPPVTHTTPIPQWSLDEGYSHVTMTPEKPTAGLAPQVYLSLLLVHPTVKTAVVQQGSLHITLRLSPCVPVQARERRLKVRNPVGRCRAWKLSSSLLPPVAIMRWDGGDEGSRQHGRLSIAWKTQTSLPRAPAATNSFTRVNDFCEMFLLLPLTFKATSLSCNFKEVAVKFLFFCNKTAPSAARHWDEMHLVSLCIC